MQDDDAVNAEAFINKASFLVSNSQHEVLNLQYKVHRLSVRTVLFCMQVIFLIVFTVFPLLVRYAMQGF